MNACVTLDQACMLQVLLSSRLCDVLDRKSASSIDAGDLLRLPRGRLRPAPPRLFAHVHLRHTCTTKLTAEGIVWNSQFE